MGDLNGTGNLLGNTITGNDGDNILHGGAGNDSLDGGAGNDTLDGGDGNDFLIGQTGNDLLLGGNGADTLLGGEGNDRMEGGAGNDTYNVDSASDQVIEKAGGGFDFVQSSVSHTLAANAESLTLLGTQALSGTGNDMDNQLIGNSGDNVLSGKEGNDSLMGQAGADNLMGDQGNDVLNGGTGNDQLNGGAGHDILTSGSGVDHFVFTSLSDSVVGADRDVITDFQHFANSLNGDKISLSAIDANTILDGDQAFHYIGTNAFTGAAGELHTVVSGTSFILEGNVDLIPSADFQIEVQHTSVMFLNDFFL